MNIEVESRECTTKTESIHSYIIRFILKCIVNINSTSSPSKCFAKIQNAFKGTQLGTDLLLLASQNDLIAFYTNIFSTEIFF